MSVAAEVLVPTLIPAVLYAGPGDGKLMDCQTTDETILMRVFKGGVMSEVHSYRFANRTERGRWVFQWERRVGVMGGFSAKGKEGEG